MSAYKKMWSHTGLSISFTLAVKIPMRAFIITHPSIMVRRVNIFICHLSSIIRSGFEENPHADRRRVLHQKKILRRLNFHWNVFFLLAYFACWYWEKRTNLGRVQVRINLISKSKKNQNLFFALLRTNKRNFKNGHSKRVPLDSNELDKDGKLTL